MNQSDNKNNDSATIATLRAEIVELKTTLLTSRVKEGVNFVIAEVLRKQLQQVYSHNELLKRRVKELENPEPRYEKLSWPGKICFLIRRVGRPLRLQEILHELRLMDVKDKALARSWNPDKLISSVLARAVKQKRIYLFSIAGTRGSFYAVEDWLNENGKLDEEMTCEMF